MSDHLQLQREKSGKTAPKQEPGLFDTIGSFPVWLLKIIDLITPEFLKTRPPSSKDQNKTQS
jgi:hypothetical protein